MCAKVAFLQCASCWGCHQSLLNSHLTLLNVLPELDIVYWPAVVDFKLHSMQEREDQSVDVGFIEGFCRTEADIANVNLWRKKCKIVVAIGSCAVLGGVPGMANLFSIDDLLERKFKDTTYVDENSQVPNQHVPKILDVIPDLHDVIKIDVDLPGCPPVPGNIIGLISTVLGQVDTKIDDTKNMCEVCPLGTCLLDQGKLCYGPITAVGQDISMLEKGYPMLGEYGVTKIPHPENAVKLLDKLTNKPLDKSEIQNTVEALLLLLKGPVPLDYLSGKADPIRMTKLDPDKIKMKKIAHPTNLDKQVEIAEYNLEGYPEIVADIIGATMAELKNNPNYIDSAKTVCSSCPNNVVDKEVIRYKRDYDGMPDPTKCLLVQGYVCMGPITKAGCGTLCPKANSPCLGCYGPALNVEEYGAKALSYFPAICRDEPENIRAFFKDPAGLFNRFNTVVSKLNHRINDNQMP